jgi:hypothetical protein
MILTEFTLEPRSRGSNFFLALMAPFRCYSWLMIDCVCLWDRRKELPRPAEAVLVVMLSVVYLRVERDRSIFVLFLSPS